MKNERRSRIRGSGGQDSTASHKSWDIKQTSHLHSAPDSSHTITYIHFLPTCTLWEGYFYSHLIMNHEKISNIPRETQGGKSREVQFANSKFQAHCFPEGGKNKSHTHRKAWPVSEGPITTHWVLPQVGPSARWRRGTRQFLLFSHSQVTDREELKSWVML